MTMKKRFLGLALATAISLPATSAYAASGTTTITGNDTDTLTQSIKVAGSVRNSQGTAPAGKLEVELPTTMAFAVDESSNFTGADYAVSNRSSVGITVSVAEFRTASGNITVKATDAFDPANQDRSNVSLTLDGRVDDAFTSVDLASVDAAGEKILDVRANDTGVLTLNGEAGKQKTGDVENNGAKGEFTLVFKINKKA